MMRMFIIGVVVAVLALILRPRGKQGEPPVSRRE